MVKFYETPSRQKLTMEEFFEKVDALEAPLFSEEFVDHCAEYLSALNNDRDLIYKHLERYPGPGGWAQRFFAPQSFLLGSSKKALLRANIWLPPKKQTGFTEYQKELYAYDLAHNHDFHFLTVGFHGPGYETDLYEIDPDSVDGTPGQSVQLRNARREQLTPGRVIYFDQYRDVHVQHEPADLSISINLIFKGERRDKDQLLFDIERSVVIGPPPLAERSRLITAMEMAARFANQKTVGLLEEMAANHPHPRVKENARRILSERGGPRTEAKESVS